MRTGLRRLTIVGIVVGVVLYIGNLVIDNPYSHRLTRAFINAEMRKHTNLTVDFEALKVRLAPPGVELYAAAIVPTERPERPLVKASHIRARLSLIDLALGNLKMNVELTDAETAWPLSVDPATLLKEPKEAAPATATTWPPNFDLPISRLVMNNARLSLAVPDQDVATPTPDTDLLHVVATGFDLDWQIDDWDDMALRTRITALDISLPSEDMQIFRDAIVELSAVVNSQGLHSRRLRIFLPNLEVGGNLSAQLVTEGRQRQLQRVQLKSEIHALGDLSVLGDILDIEDTKGKTNADATITLEIPIHDTGEPVFLVEGKASVEDAYLDNFSLGNSNAKFRIDTDKLDFTEINAVVGQQLVGKAKGRIAFNQAADYHFEGSLEKLPLSQLLKALTVDFDDIDGDLGTPDLVIKGTGEPFLLDATATTQLEHIRSPLVVERATKYKRGPACRLPLKLRANNKRLTLFEMQGQCFHWPEANTPAVPSAGDVNAPAGALMVSPLAAEGVFHFNEREGMRLELKSPALNLGLTQFFTQLPAKGSSELQIIVQGAYDKVVTAIDAKAHDVHFAGAPLDAVQIKTNVTPQKIRWSNIEAKVGSHGMIRSEGGELDIDNLHIVTTLLVTEIPSTFIHEILKTSADLTHFDFGIEHLQADVRGPLLYPLRLLGEANISLNAGRYEDQKIFDRLAWMMRRSTDKGWNIDNLRLVNGDLGITGNIAHEPNSAPVSGQVTPFTRLMMDLGLQGSDKIDVDLSMLTATRPDIDNGGIRSRVAALPPNHLASIPYAAPYFAMLGMRGEITGSAKLTGNFNRLQGSFQLAVSKISILDSPMAPFHFRGFADGSKLDLMVSHSGDALQGRLALDFLDPQLPYEWYLHAKRFDARPLGTKFFYSDPRNYAYLTASWEMKGRFSQWWQSIGNAAIDDLRVKFIRDSGQNARALDLNLDQPIRFTFNASGWNIDDQKDLLLTGNNLRLRLATKNNRPPQNFGLMFDGFMDIHILKDIWDQIESATGQMRFNGEIAGSVSTPKINVRFSDVEQTTLNAATWEPLTLGMADIRPPFRNIKVNAEYQEGQLLIRSLHAEKGVGTVAIDGVLNLDPQTKQQTLLNIRANNATIIYPVAVLKSFDTNIDANLTLSGTSLPLRLAGDVGIARARSFRDFDIRNEIVDTLRKRTMVAEPNLREPFINLDLGVRANNSVAISNRNLQAILSGDLQITGNDVNPVVSGQIEVTRGKFEYKREFRIEQAVISFDDPVRPDPRLNIVGVSEVSSYRIYVNITGKASDPRVDLTIDPPTRDGGTPISKVDILVLLSSGTLPASGNQFGESQAAATTEALNIVAGQFEEPVEKLFDLSGQKVVRQVYIDTTSDVDGKPVPRFNMPLNLGEDVNVVLRVVDQNKWRVSSEYSLHESISLSGNLDGQDNSGSSTNRNTAPADTGVDLKFRFAYP